MIRSHMLKLAQIEKINDHVRRLSRAGRVVAIARALRKDDGSWFELTAAAWANSRLASHPEVATIRDFNRLVAAGIASRFIERANRIFYGEPRARLLHDIDRSAPAGLS
jgi:hypothetical protein